MFFINGKFCKVWKILDTKEKYVKIQLGTSDKQQDGTYKNSTWSAFIMGKQLELAKQLKEGDVINVLKGKVENVYNKEKQVSYCNVAIFEFEVEGGSNTPPASKKVEEEDDFPF